MTVGKFKIIARGLAARCPNCGQRSLFPPRSLRIRLRCPDCGTGFDRGEGFFLGPWVLNYTIVVFLVVIPAIVAGVVGVIPWTASLIISGAACVVLPALLYRSTWAWWLTLYFLALPQRLPANGGPIGAAAED